jgi:hypothetical protein
MRVMKVASRGAFVTALQVIWGFEAFSPSYCDHPVPCAPGGSQLAQERTTRIHCRTFSRWYPGNVKRASHAGRFKRERDRMVKHTQTHQALGTRRLTPSSVQRHSQLSR